MEDYCEIDSTGRQTWICFVKNHMLQKWFFQFINLCSIRIISSFFLSTTRICDNITHIEAGSHLIWEQLLMAFRHMLPPLLFEYSSLRLAAMTQRTAYLQSAYQKSNPCCVLYPAIRQQTRVIENVGHIYYLCFPWNSRGTYL